MHNPHSNLSPWKGEAADSATCSFFHCARDLAYGLREELGDQGVSRLQGAAGRIGASAARRDADEHRGTSHARRSRADSRDGDNNAPELGTTTALANAAGKFSR